MRRPTSSFLSAVIAIGSAIAGCTPVEPPARPAWDQHVMPLLQGRCNHCHGETWGKNLDPDSGAPLPPATRLDFCMNGTAAMQEVGVGVSFGAAAALKMFFMPQFEPDAKTGRANMPPPPAEPLSEYEYQVLKKWAKIAEADADAACLKAVRNRAPRVKLLEPPQDTGDAVEATVEITDPDTDGILGKATLGPATIDIPGGGRRTLRFPDGTPTGGDLKVVVTDGYDVGRL